MTSTNHLIRTFKNQLGIRLKLPGLRRSGVIPIKFPALCFTLVLLLWTFFASLSLAVNPESVGLGQTAPDTVEDAVTPLSVGLEQKEVEPSRIPKLEKKIEDLPPFLKNTKLNFHIRSFYFDRKRKEGKESEAWALGGWIDYQSGRWKDILQIGAVLYTSQKLYGPDDKGGTLLLQPIQEGFTTLGQAYLDAKIMEGLHFRGYRQTFNLPYVNKRDSRMVPNTFEALSVVGRSIHNTDFIVAHITKMKPRNATDFRWISHVAGVNSVKKGMTLAGARYTFNKELNMGVISQYAWDLWNTLYAEANYSKELAENAAIAVSAQYTDQRSVGDNLAGDFDTDVFSAQTGMSYLGNILTFAFSTTDRNHRVRNPFGSYPGYLSLIIEDFKRAGENAWLAGMSSRFRFLGLPGFSAFANYAQGTTPDSGVNASPDQRELDITTDYRIKDGFLKSLWFRFRAAFVRKDGPHIHDVDEYQLIMNFDIPVL